MTEEKFPQFSDSELLSLQRRTEALDTHQLEFTLGMVVNAIEEGEPDGCSGLLARRQTLAKTLSEELERRSF